jgi:hypothetical protein
MKLKFTTTLSLIGMALSASLFGQTPITDPVPDPLPSEGIGVQVEKVVRIPDSPSNGESPRLNMLKEAPDGSAESLSLISEGTCTRFFPTGPFFCI